MKTIITTKYTNQRGTLSMIWASGLIIIALCFLGFRTAAQHEIVQELDTYISTLEGTHKAEAKHLHDLFYTHQPSLLIYDEDPHNGKAPQISLTGGSHPKVANIYSDALNPLANDNPNFRTIELVVFRIGDESKRTALTAEMLSKLPALKYVLIVFEQKNVGVAELNRVVDGWEVNEDITILYKDFEDKGL